MEPSERRAKMAKADSFEELLAYACEEPLDEKKYLTEWVNEVESFLEERGHSRSKPRKMAVVYVLLRHGHSIRSAVKWWGEPDNSYWSLSVDTALEYAETFEQIIEEHEDADDGEGIKLYEPSEDPLEEYYDVSVSSRNTGLGEFT